MHQRTVRFQQRLRDLGGRTSSRSENVFMRSAFSPIFQTPTTRRPSGHGTSCHMPERVLRRIPADVVEELWTEVLIERVRRETDGALDGQRLRIQDLPRAVLERFTSR